MAKKNKIIYTIKENCAGCNKCNSGCPAIFANIASIQNGENKIRVDQNKCIHCGQCIDQCDHNARNYYDDTEKFFNALKSGLKLSLIVAPSVRNNFDDYEKLLGFFKKMGVKLIYDVSFGADISIWSFLKVFDEQKILKQVQDDKLSLITAPCPVIVNYIEKYRPELIKHLAPAHSPAICTALYMKKYENLSDRIAFLSPCIAKTDEISDPNTQNLVKYNITFKKLKEYLSEKKINLNDFEKTGFDSPDCALGLTFPRPGGLSENLLYHRPDIFLSEIHGTNSAFKYLDEYSQRMQENKFLPDVVDILSCDMGCAIGTGTNKEAHPDDINFKLNNLKNQKLNKYEFEKQHPLFEMFDEKLDINHFIRNFSDKSSMVEDIEPLEDHYDYIFNQMHKTTEASRNINCNACGYGSCKGLAKSILRGTNHRKNCLYYNQKELEIEQQLLARKNVKLSKALRNLRDFTEERKQNEIRLKSIPFKMMDGFFMTDTEGNIEISNPAVKKIFGYSAAELQGTKIQSLLPNIDFEHYSDENFTNILKEETCKNKKGEEVNVEIGLSKINVERHNKYIFIVRDISARKQVEKLKDEFVSVVSHELRTPLTTIKASLKLLSIKKIKANKKKTQILIDNALESSSILVSLLNDLLDTQKFKSGKMSYDIEPLELMPIVNTVVTFNRPYANEHNINLRIKRSLNDAKVNADKNRLIQVITNLISNAVKFSPAGSVVSVSVYRYKEFIRVSVSDKGRGIAPEDTEAWRGEANSPGRVVAPAAFG